MLVSLLSPPRHEEWFREIYDPVIRAERVACRRSEAKAAAARLLKDAAAEGGIDAVLASYSVVDAQTPAPAPGAPPMISRCVCGCVCVCVWLWLCVAQCTADGCVVLRRSREPDETCLFLGKMPRTVARASVERCFEDAEGFQNVLLGPAWETRAYVPCVCVCVCAGECADSLLPGLTVLWLRLCVCV